MPTFFRAPISGQRFTGGQQKAIPRRSPPEQMCLGALYHPISSPYFLKVSESQMANSGSVLLFNEIRSAPIERIDLAASKSTASHLAIMDGEPASLAFFTSFGPRVPRPVMSRCNISAPASLTIFAVDFRSTSSSVGLNLIDKTAPVAFKLLIRCSRELKLSFGLDDRSISKRYPPSAAI